MQIGWFYCLQCRVKNSDDRISSLSPGAEILFLSSRCLILVRLHELLALGLWR